ncbi:phosphoribosylformylglycinamidine cyclo-ligase [Pediococcus stilesii]|uniref:Phosphoribosylformylglycinamidine cyclo-ligase n=1 Tax=Pediococcus stilesii TaxID=331679 RepID=A0A5R9BTL9_9LACO|nr:phosphoribosylformylglycinamidine cyclo-ligase [Pediococcus stilesii]TLQ04058.1 phosphoribosylformylglycinamidine cyclo-ligase [Pediococcus stilesii]
MTKNAYEKAGVNIAAGEAVVEDLKKNLIHNDPHILGGIGSFAGCYQMSSDQLDHPVLVAGTDGVGTKVLLAAEADRVETIGQDLVAMCVNDLLAQGALPLFFLDYLALSHLDEQQVKKILNGVLKACQTHSIALLGGETAEMPGIYEKKHFDLAGFAVGLANKDSLFSPAMVSEDDVLIGLPSSGLHSNGYSLVRKILFEDHQYQFTDVPKELNQDLITELLTPTRIYVNTLRPLLEEHLIRGAAHITGGGLLDNVPRMLPDNLQAEFNLQSWTIPPIFSLLSQLGDLSQSERYQTFNMGIGMVLAVKRDQVDRVEQILANNNELFYEIGNVKRRSQDAPDVELLESDNG